MDELHLFNWCVISIGPCNLEAILNYLGLSFATVFIMFVKTCTHVHILADKTKQLSLLKNMNF